MIKVSVKEEDLGLNKLLASLRVMSADKSVLYVGIQYPNRQYANGSTVGVVGMAHEFGAPTSTPPTTEKRYMRNTLARQKKTYFSIVKQTMEQELARNRTLSARSIFLTLGPVMKNDIQDAVRSIDLIDTSLLLRSIGFRVGKRAE